MKIFATYSIKGGVGKTAAAANLAYFAARDGRRTLLWDLDAQGAASYLLRVKPKVKGGGKAVLASGKALAKAIKQTEYEGLDLAPADFTYRNLDLLLDDAKKPTRQLSRLLAPFADAYDVIVLDCPPGISLVSENVLRAADVLLVPIIPSTLSLRTLDQLTGFVADLDHKPELLAFFSMVDRRKKLHRETMDQLRAARGDVADIVIPAQSQVEQMAVHQAPVAEFAPRGQAAVSYRALWAEIRRRTD